MFWSCFNVFMFNDRSSLPSELHRHHSHRNSFHKEQQQPPQPPQPQPPQPQPHHHYRLRPWPPPQPPQTTKEHVTNATFFLAFPGQQAEPWGIARSQSQGVELDQLPLVFLWYGDELLNLMVGRFLFNTRYKDSLSKGGMTILLRFVLTWRDLIKLWTGTMHV